MDYTLSDLIGQEELRLIAEACSKASGVAISIKNASDDQMLVGAGWQEICAGFHRAHPLSSQRCAQQRGALLTGFHTLEDDSLCANGLRHVAIPMLVEGRHLATYYLTQFFYDTDSRDRGFFRAQAREFGFDEEAYLRALDKVPVLTRERVREIIAYVTIFSRLIADLATRNLRLKRAMEEKERIQASLRDTNALTASILDVIASPIFIKNRAGTYTGCNDAFAAFIGRTREELLGKGVFELFREEDARKYYEMDEALMSSGGVQMYDFRITRPSGERRDVMFSKAATRDTQGRVNGLVGVITDITERNQAARELRESKARYRFLARYSADIIWRLDADQRFIYASPADERIRGFHHSEIQGQPVWSAMHPDHVGLMQERWRDYLASIRGNPDPAPLRVEVPLLRKGGDTLWAEILSNPVRGDDGAVSGYLLVARDTTERKRHEEQLVFISTHDALTGLYNRSHFEAEFRRSAQGRLRPLSVIAADVDGLKAVNDRLGHAAGDAVIMAAADILRRSFRTGDLVARLGGDEFAVLLAGADEKAAEDALGRIHAEMRAYAGEESPAPIHLSLGAATARTTEETDQVLREADRRMYEDKARRKAGRDEAENSAKL